MPARRRRRRSRAKRSGCPGGAGSARPPPSRAARSEPRRKEHREPGEARELGGRVPGAETELARPRVEGEKKDEEKRRADDRDEKPVEGPQYEALRRSERLVRRLARDERDHDEQDEEREGEEAQACRRRVGRMRAARRRARSGGGGRWVQGHPTAASRESGCRGSGAFPRIASAARSAIIITGA